MRIYNGTKFTLTLPYAGGENLTIAPKTPSGNVLCTNDFISMIITSYTTEEVAIIAAGPFEVTACANVPTATNYVVQSLEEAIARFNPSAAFNKKEEPKKTAEPEVKEEAAPAPVPTPEPKKEEPKKEEPKKEEPKKEELQPMTPVMTPVKKEEKKVKKEELKKDEPKKEEEQK